MDPIDEIGTETLTPVVGGVHARPEKPDSLVVLWVDPDLAVIPRARVGFTHPCPCFTFVFRTKDATLVIFNNGIYDVGILAINRYPYSPHISHRKILGELVPCVAPIDGFVETAPWTRTVESKSSSPALIGRGI